MKVLNTGIKCIKSNEKNTNFEITNDIKDEHLNKLVSLAKDEPQKYQINSNNKFIYKYHELNSEIRRQNINELLDEIFLKKIFIINIINKYFFCSRRCG